MRHPNNVKKIRLEKKLDQQFVADKIHLGLRAYQKIESGETKLDAERMQDLAKVFNVSMLDLICNDGNIHIEKIENNVGGISNKEVTINQNTPIDEIKIAYNIVIQTKDSHIADLKNEIEVLRKENEQLKHRNTHL